MREQTWIDISRTEWVPGEGTTTQDSVKLGCIQRIADGIENLARSRDELEREAKWQKQRADSHYTLLETEQRRSAAYRGVIGGLKRQLDALENSR